MDKQSEFTTRYFNIWRHRRPQADMYGWPDPEPVTYTKRVRFVSRALALLSYMEACFEGEATLGRFIKDISDPYDNLLMARRRRKMFTKGYVTCVLKSFGIEVI